MRVEFGVPRPKYPEKTDSYRELFKVYDSSEAFLAADVEIDSRYIQIVPRSSDRGPDVWGENGFVTIEDETIYYDSVSYLEIESSTPLQPITYDGNNQVYRLSKCQQILIKKEIVNPVRVGVEVSIKNPELALTSEIQEITDDILSPDKRQGITLLPPFSMVGRFLRAGHWYTFVSKDAGGEIGSFLQIISQEGLISGVSSIILSASGLSFFGALPDLVEITYISTPDRDETVAPNTINVSYEGTVVIQEEQIVGSTVSEFTLDRNTGTLTILWSSIDRKDIDVSFSSGIIYNLENCMRGYNTESRPHKAGTRVSGYVMAEHHNNLAKAILGVERWVGSNSSSDPTSIDGLLHAMEDLSPEINPECPQGTLDYDVLDQGDQYQGPLVSFTLSSSDSSNNKIFFGDGQSQDNVGNIIHRYARGSQFAPSAMFQNATCQEYTSAITEEGISVILPAVIVPIIPDIDLNPSIWNLPANPTTVGTEINLGLGGLITMPDLNLPGQMNFKQLTIPTMVQIPTEIQLPTLISIAGPVLPTQISIAQINIPSGIRITGVSLPSIINIQGIALPSIISLSIPTIPTISFGTFPTIPTFISFGSVSIPTFISISFNMIPIPSLVVVTGINIPSMIVLTGLNIPSQINIAGVSIPTEIRLIGGGLPPNMSITLSIAVDTSSISGNCFKLVPCTV